MHVIKGKEIAFIEREGLRLKIFPTTLSDKTEFIYVESKTGHGPKVIQKTSDFAYFIVSGSGYFDINGEREDCETGDLIVIPAGTMYTYVGEMTIVASSTPPWTEEQQVTL